MNMCSTSTACAVLTELRDQEGVKAITDYSFYSTSEETKVLATLMPPEVLNFKPTHGGHNQSKASEAACTSYGYVHITIGSVWMEFTAKLNRAGECF